MDRQIVYSGQIPLDSDQLNQNRNTMVGLGYALQAVLGTSTLVDGLACSATIPASLSVNVAGGSIYSLQNIDGSAFGSIGSDTAHSIVKQGIIKDATNLTCAAPVTVGQSINYLIQAAYEDLDGGSTVLPYYNASNPSQAYNGPNNSGTSQNTVRQGICLLGIKAGIAATTGMQTTPAPDAGYVGLFAVSVANGQTTITSGNIQQLATAPFIAVKLGSLLQTIQAGSTNYATDTSGAANTITASLSPVPASLTAGLALRVMVANTNTGSTQINLNGLGNVAIHNPDGTSMHASQLRAGNIYTFVYDGTVWELQSLPADFQSFLVNSVATLTSSSTLTGTNNRTLIVVNAASAAFTTSLIAATGNQGYTVFITKSDSSGNAVTIDGNGASIGLFTQILLRSQGESVFLYCDGTNWEVLSHTGKRKMVAVFTSTGTFNVPVDVKSLEKVTVIGAGGGGGGAAINTSGGGGAAGGTAIGFNVAVTPGGSITVTIGAGAPGGTGTPTNGSTGGNSTFGSSSPLTANGGGGGFSAGTGGAPGTATGGTVNINGGGGGSGATVSGTSSGLGGSSSFGGGGPGVNNGNAGSIGAAYGSGGSGGAGSGSSGFAGGNGKDGIVLIEYSVGQ